MVFFLRQEFGDLRTNNAVDDYQYEVKLCTEACVHDTIAIATHIYNLFVLHGVFSIVKVF